MSRFLDLAELGEKLASTKKKLEHSALIGTYLRGLPPDELPVAARLLIGRPLAETDPRILNVSGAALVRVLEAMVGTPIDWSPEAVDFGQAVETWLNSLGWTPKGEPLALLEVQRAYDELAEHGGAGSRELKHARLAQLLERAAPLEAKYIVKQLTGEMRVGVNEGALLDALSRSLGIPSAVVRRANQLTGDIGKVTQTALLEGRAGLEQVSLALGRPIKPMLAQSASSIADALQAVELPVALEHKLDGARLQIHKDAGQVKLFSRHLSDLSASLPEIAELVRGELQAHRAIVEGEVVATDSGGRPLPFQVLMRRIGRERDIETIQREIPVQLYLFDCLYCEGSSLLDQPNTARWAALESIAGKIPLVPRLVVASIEEGEAFLNAARAAGHEGVMVKVLQAPYTPGERGKHWLKVKPVLTLDLVIVASDWGYGRRHGWLSNQHLAARDAETGTLLEVGKTFKGLTDEEFRALTQKLLDLKVRESRGTVWVKPEIVVEVAFNNIQRSPSYKSGVALRHARIVTFRPDKTPADVETVQTLRAMMEREHGKEA